MTFKVLDLFSGIGGFSLGLERTGGFETVAFCEIEPFCRRVLAKHWPEVPCYDDVRTLTADRLRADGIAVDVICGGFPCQDISVAGKQVGITGERSGLWSEIARLAGELRPRFLIVENVAALLSNGLDRVLGDLAALRFDAEWHCIPAAALGAPHVRDRWWLVAYPNSEFVRDEGCAETSKSPRAGEGFGQEWQWVRPDVATGGCRADVADTTRQRCGEAREHRQRQAEWAPSGSSVLSDADQARLPNGLAGRLRAELTMSPSGRWWGSEPDVGRVAHGVPSWVDRLRALGNAVVPQIPELIGNAILASLSQSEAA
ncbi:DNA cytosine methyltransferase [Methylobacterium komagatae]